MDVVWPVAGTVLSLRYRLTEQLSSGGMSQVWRAEDELLGRAVAIKLSTLSAAVVQQAFTEARTAARLSHPHIAAVHDYGETKRPDGTIAPFVVMELLEGRSLAARLTDGPLGTAEAARIGAQVADGLAAAHAKRVVHRDVKPGNVMLTPTGAKILDFGISAVFGAPDDDDTGATFGTPAYVAPERLDGKPAEPATDVYGLGVVLFEMVTGDPPYPVDTWEELTAARVAGPSVLPPETPAGFRDLVQHCLADSPEQRPSAADLRAGLAALAGGPSSPPAKSFTSGRAEAHTVAMQKPQKPPKRPIVRIAAVVLLLAAAGVAVLIGSWAEDERSTPPVSAPPPASDTAAPPEPAPTRAETSQAVLGVDEAVGRVASEVEAGQAAGRIRDDVAVDLLNLVRQLEQVDRAEIPARVDQLRQKVRIRVTEEGIDRDQAAALQTRLDELGRASGA